MLDQTCAMKSPDNHLSLAALESRVTNALPLLPGVVTRLAALNRYAVDYFDRVSALASVDPSFAAQLIRLANSPLSAPMKPITSIDTAIVRLGVNAVAGLVTTMAVMRVFVPTETAQQRMWVHSIEVAVGARTIANAMPGLHDKTDTAYLAGLLHDIGRFIMFEQTPDLLRSVEQTLWDTPHALLLADIELFQFTHSELGFLACKKWGFPREILEVVRQHHRYFEVNQSGLAKELEELLIVVQIADLLSNLLLHADFARNDTATQTHLIQENCLHPEWGWLPFDERFLQESSITIREESLRLARDLGVA